MSSHTITAPPPRGMREGTCEMARYIAQECDTLEQDLTSWDVGKVENTNSMFKVRHFRAISQHCPFSRFVHIPSH